MPYDIYSKDGADAAFAPKDGVLDGGTASAPLYDIRIRHDDTAGWAAEDPILSLGEEGIDVDTGTRKVGDGVTAWSSLPDRLGDEADARAAADAALDGRVDALEVAPPAHAHPLADVIGAGTAAAADVGDFATAAQGVLADSATQPGHAHAGGDITSGTVAYARLPVGTTASTLAAGDDSRITGAAQKSANLSDLASTATARTNLGLADSAVVGALPIPDPGSYYPTDTLTAALQLIGGREQYGTGSPEGVVTAPVGTYYTDTAITNGAMRWAKKAGTGNTGWQCVEGDTGNRLVNDAVAGFTRSSGNVYFRRIGQHCYLTVAALVPTANVNLGNGDMRLTIPTGFTPYGTQAGLFAKSNGLATVYSGATSGSTFYLAARLTPTVLASWAATDPLGGALTYRTPDPWPTSLPGVAA
jgi:hypothetical protein